MSTAAARSTRAIALRVAIFWSLMLFALGTILEMKLKIGAEFILAGAVLIVVAIILPAPFARAAPAQQRIGRKAVDVFLTGLLGVIYFLIFVPVAVFYRALQRSPRREGWHDRTQPREESAS